MKLTTFEKNLAELYWLAYLLTGNEDRSVHASSSALDIDDGLFDGEKKKWARALTIVEALGTIETVLRRSLVRVAQSNGEEMASQAEWMGRARITTEEFEDAVLRIDAFPRCAMLLTIFEGLPIKATALLLNASMALTAAAQRIGIVQLTARLAAHHDREQVAALSFG
ncbi:MAG: hypothetical protein ABSF22_01290 [Bryobacteraceae bacterium]|jgi:hypothetical protein